MMCYPSLPRNAGILARKGMKPLVICAAVFFSGATAWAADRTCKVIDVPDGDSLLCLTPQEQRLKLRLADIDAPEMSQGYGPQARSQLFRLVYNRNVDFEVVEQSRYGARIARVRTKDLDVNAEMVKLGAAWVYSEFNRDSALPQLEAEAKSAKRGLWSQPQSDIVEPWLWRKSRASSLSQKSQP